MMSILSIAIQPDDLTPERRAALERLSGRLEVIVSRDPKRFEIRGKTLHLERFATGHPLRNVVNTQRGYCLETGILPGILL